MYIFILYTIYDTILYYTVLYYTILYYTTPCTIIGPCGARVRLNACSAECAFGAVFGVPGVFGSGFTVVFGSVRQQTIVCFCLQLNACSCVHIYLYIYIYIHIHTYIHTYTYIYIYVYIYIHMCIHICNKEQHKYSKTAKTNKNFRRIRWSTPAPTTGLAGRRLELMSESGWAKGRVSQRFCACRGHQQSRNCHVHVSPLRTSCIATEHGRLPARSAS